MKLPANWLCRLLHLLQQSRGKGRISERTTEALILTVPSSFDISLLGSNRDDILGRKSGIERGPQLPNLERRSHTVRKNGHFVGGAETSREPM
jgi:hypothetical protein